MPVAESPCARHGSCECERLAAAFPKPRLAGALLCVTIVGASCFGALLTHRERRNRPGTVRRTLPTAPREARMPFRIGEKLDYRVAWASFANAASIELTVPERRDLMGWGTWHFRASAHTLSPMRAMIAVDDQFDSYTDAATLESRQYETYLNEMGQKQTEVFHFLAEGQPSRGHMAGVVVTPGTRDPLGAAYALRGVDWAQTPEFRAPVYDGHDVYDMRARLDVPSRHGSSGGRNFLQYRNLDSPISAWKRSAGHKLHCLAGERRGANTGAAGSGDAFWKLPSGIGVRCAMKPKDRGPLKRRF